MRTHENHSGFCILRDLLHKLELMLGLGPLHAQYRMSIFLWNTKGFEGLATHTDTYCTHTHSTDLILLHVDVRVHGGPCGPSFTHEGFSDRGLGLACMVGALMSHHQRTQTGC